MRINADTTRCMSSGQCVLIDPDVFDQREADDVVVVRVDDVAEAHLDRVRQAVHVCPGRALSLVEP